LTNFQTNPQLQLAFDFVQYTGRNIFLTGKAGTGKTTFLHNLKQISTKRMVVVAPTGVAAINAAGVTIHSFFQLSFGPQIPEYTLAQESNDKQSGVKRFSKEKINIIRSMDLLVIDEISMVRADLLDGIDATLRRFRNRSQPFGGVQLLMIGDLQQLAPVVKENEWGLLRKHYDTPFFFSSNALKKTNYVTVELTFVFRQRDEAFINLLNKVRDNIIDQVVVDTLNKNYHPDLDFDKSGYIILTTHNAKAKAINDARMEKLQGKAQKFKAKIEGNFPEFTYPTDYDLHLKEGAQVMFVKNDPEPEKQFYNGKIGTVVKIDKEQIEVSCEGDEENIEVVPLEWRKVKYSLNDDTKEITESVEGTFVQYPLKLAWAITIHKSQGLTFEKAIIDAEAAFAHGQVYVALSRCKSLEGMILSSKITSTSIKHDSTVERFTKDFEEKQPDSNELEKSKHDYQYQLLTDLFDFQTIRRRIYYLMKLVNEHDSSLQVDLKDPLLEMSNKVKDELVIVSEKFNRQLTALLSTEPDAEKNEPLQERVEKAAAYFSEKVKKQVIEKADELVIETDNKAVRKSLSDALKKLMVDAEFKNACLHACENGFTVQDYLKAKAKASIEEPARKRSRKKAAEPVDETIKHPELYQRLKHWRNAKVDELNLPYYGVLPLKTIRELSNKLPVTLPALKAIKGMGKKKLAMFGGELIEIITDYCDEIDFQPEPYYEPEITPKKPTKQISFELWKEGKPIDEIATERGFTVTTIERHLVHYVETGDIPIEKLVSPNHIQKITEFFHKNPDILLGEAKSILGDEISWSELHFVKATFSKDKTQKD